MSRRDVEVADTLPPEEAAPPVVSASGPPVTSWERYELLELLGKGGMGLVYKARDRRLGRIVAIKFILGVDPSLTLRLLREARAQANIAHPNICGVYEVDEVEGRAYLALQFVDGEPLNKAAARMPLEDKIAVLRDVALAVHEAHERGIVHRDLKPANVLVERTGDGRWFPVVMDFGLARETTVGAGITESGVPVGTPAYMSPEQARGDIHVVDRRSDVYSLGATLYDLVTGCIPFPATTLATALDRVIHDEPLAPRKLVPNLAVDLETIALKCLAKDPAQRYASARALADDLGRHLAGEPITGRRVSWWGRVWRRARRHRMLVLAGTSAISVILVLAAFGIRERWRAADRARLAEHLGREATAIESSLREAYLLPLHDIRRDRERVRERMRAIAATQHDLGELGDALVHEALGRGHLALHEWREANSDLSAAGAAPQTSELHAARGRALGELYRGALEEIRRTVDRATDRAGQALLARRQQELEQRYLVPARAELENIRRSGGDSALLEARIALYRRDFAAAERLAQAEGNTQQLPELRELAADAAYGAAIAAFDHGDYKAARPALEHASALYAEASDAARSDPSLYTAEAQMWLRLAEVDFRTSGSPGAAVDRAVDIIDKRSLRANPDDVAAYTTKADVLLLLYRASVKIGKDARLQLLERIAGAARRAVEIDERDANARTSLGNAHVYRGIYELNSGDSEPWLRAALEELSTAVAIEPNHLSAHNGLGTAHRWLAAYRLRSGAAPIEEYQAALRSYERATDIEPGYLAACTNQIEVLTSIAEYEDAVGRDPQPTVEKAQRVGKRCLAIDHNFFSVFNNLAQADLALAQYLVERGGDPADALNRARHDIDSSEAAQPGSLEVRYYRAVAARIRAAFELREHIDPSSSIATARAALEEALALYAESALSYVEAARLGLIDAEWASQTGNDAVARLAEARVAADTAIQLDDKRADAHLVAAGVCLAMAKAQPSPGVIESGIDHVRQARQRNPQLQGAQAVFDELLLLQRAVEPARK